MIRSQYYSKNGINQGYTTFSKNISRPPYIVNSGVGWHYTSISSAKKIIETQSFLSGSYRGLNDFSELRYGLSLIHDEIVNNVNSMNLHEDILNYLNNFNQDNLLNENSLDIYTISASRKIDIESQWALYGDSGYGVALGLDLSKLFRPFPNEYKFGGRYSAMAMSWLKVLYSEQAQRRAIRILISEFDVDYKSGVSSSPHTVLENLIILLSITLKEKSFFNEKEVRSVFITRNISPTFVFDENRNKKYMPWRGAQYETEPSLQNLRPALKESMLPICGIKFGPRFHASAPESQELLELIHEMQLRLNIYK